MWYVCGDRDKKDVFPRQLRECTRQFYNFTVRKLLKSEKMSSGKTEELNFQEMLEVIRRNIGGKWKLYSSENMEEALREMGKEFKYFYTLRSLLRGVENSLTVLLLFVGCIA